MLEGGLGRLLHGAEEQAEGPRQDSVGANSRGHAGQGGFATGAQPQCHHCPMCPAGVERMFLEDPPLLAAPGPRGTNRTPPADFQRLHTQVKGKSNWESPAPTPSLAGHAPYSPALGVTQGFRLHHSLVALGRTKGGAGGERAHAKLGCGSWFLISPQR